MLALAGPFRRGHRGSVSLRPDGRRDTRASLSRPIPSTCALTELPHTSTVSPRAIRDVAAVTGAVQMVEREFWQSTRWHGRTVRVVMNDVDICLRSQMENCFVVYTPYVELLHHVGSSRGNLTPSRIATDSFAAGHLWLVSRSLLPDSLLLWARSSTTFCAERQSPKHQVALVPERVKSTGARSDRLLPGDFPLRTSDPFHRVCSCWPATRCTYWRLASNDPISWTAGISHSLCRIKCGRPAIRPDVGFITQTWPPGSRLTYSTVTSRGGTTTKGLANHWPVRCSPRQLFL